MEINAKSSKNALYYIKAGVEMTLTDWFTSGCREYEVYGQERVWLVASQGGLFISAVGEGSDPGGRFGRGPSPLDRIPSR